jgi:CheY-like chemotaxis protein
VRMLIVELLNELGYGAIEASGGPSRLTILRSGARFDLLISDVALPTA